MNIRAKIYGGSAPAPILRDKPKKQSSQRLADIKINREEARRINNRDQDRFRLADVSFGVTYRGTTSDAQILNLSGGGAMIAAVAKPKIGDRLFLHLGEGGEMECAVRWIKDGRLGLEFAHETRLECSDDEQAELLRDVIRRDFPDEKFARPGPKDQTPDPTEARSEMRHPLIWWGVLHHGSHEAQVRIRNISRRGALIECDAPAGIGAGIVLELGKAGTVTAIVSWAVGGYIGLSFDEQFDMRRLAKAQPRVTPPTWLRPDFLRREVELDSPWDEAWTRMSVEELKSELEGFLKR